MSETIRVAVIDNDKLVPAGLRALLAGYPDIAVVHDADSVSDHLAAGAPADVVLLDLMLGDGTHPAANVAALRATGARVIIISVHGERRHVRATVHAGACGYLVKDNDGDTLAEAIRAVHAGGLALTTDLMSLINDDPPPLSPQEYQALYLYGTGSTLVATARRMGVSISTVRSYLERIRTKWAAADQPVDDIRALIHEYPHPGGESGLRRRVGKDLPRIVGTVPWQRAWSPRDDEGHGAHRTADLLHALHPGRAAHGDPALARGA